MHSSAVFASVLFAVAYAAPAVVPSASSSTSSVPSYTADAALKPTSSVTVSYTADAPYKPTSSKSTKSATATANYVGKPASTGSVNAYEAALPAAVKANPRSGDLDLIAKLLTAPLQGDRARLLNQPGDMVFDFNESPEGSESNGKGGHTVAANGKTFPALIGNSAAMTLGFLGPCGLNSPHVHPRSSEFNVVVEGRLVTNFVQENGVAFQANTLSKYQATIFPAGALHQEFNPDCEDAVFVAGFHTVDPGVEQMAQSFFGLRSDVISATLNGVQNIDGADIDSFRDTIPANVALGVEQCLQKCGIKRNAKRSLAEILA